MLKRILFVWFSANFAIPGIFALLNGGWYLRLPTFVGMAAELGLIMVPNLLFPILLLRYFWPAPVSSIRQELGWQPMGWRPVLIGVLAFSVYLILSTFLSGMLGPGISYGLPGQSGGIGGWLGLLALFAYILFVVITVISEETRDGSLIM